MISAPRDRLAGLDVLRCVAVLLVLGRHLPTVPARLPALALWERGGWAGVDLFFVLSGFLVSGLLLRDYVARGDFSIARFYVRRGWKIYPPFLALIGVTALMPAGERWPPDPSWPRLGAELLFVQSYLPAAWNHTWSLAVEEHFYLVLPLLLALLLRHRRWPLTSIVAVAGCVALAALALRRPHWYQPFDLQSHVFASHLRMDGLFFGVAIAAVYHLRREQFVAWLRPWRWGLLVAGVLLLSPVFVVPLGHPWTFTYGFTVNYVASGLMLTGMLLFQWPRHWLTDGISTLGAYSYSIYLWHMPVLKWGVPAVERALGTPLGYGARAAIYLAGSLLAGIVMAKLIELPALRLRDRLCPAAGREPAVPVNASLSVPV